VRYVLRNVNNRYIWLPLLRLNPQTEGFPLDDFRKIFSECQRMAKVTNGEETLPKISTGRVGRTNVNRRTTDGRTTAHSERERECMFAKNSAPVNNVTYRIKHKNENMQVRKNALSHNP